MPLSLDEVAFDPEMGQCFSVQRQNNGAGVYAAGGWIPGPIQTLTLYGIVTIASAKALEQVPEGDRVTGSVQVICNQPLYVTSEDREATSDIVVWNGDQYRVQSVAKWFMWGYFSAIVVRMKGA